MNVKTEERLITPTVKFSETNIICPYCGQEHCPDEEKFYKKNELSIKCTACRQSFLILVNHTVSWTTYQDCSLNKKKHSWTSTSANNDCVGMKHMIKNKEKTYCECQNCGQTDFL